MNLNDVLNQLADDTDPRTLPEPAEVRRVGDHLRVKARRWAAAVGVAALVLGAGIVAAVERVDSSAPQPANGIDGWSVTRTLHVPDNGSMFYGDGSLWVVNQANRELTDDGVPAGELYQIDPTSGEVLDRVPEAIGGYASVGAGYVWLYTAVLGTTTRVSLSDHDVTRIDHYHPPRGPSGFAVVGDNVWVAYNEVGNLVRLDPDTGDIVQTVHVGSDAMGNSPQRPVTDGESVWVSTDNGRILRFDGATGKRLSWLQLPAKEVRIVGLDADRRRMYAVDGHDKSLWELKMDEEVAWTGRQLPLSQDVNRGFVAAVAVGDDAIWVAAMYPDELLRIDPDSFKVTGRMPLTGVDHESNTPVNLAYADHTLWVRTEDTVLELQPDE